MSDSGDNQEIESETTVKTVKRRGKKRTPTKVARKSKKPRSNETSEGLLANNNKLPVQQLTLYAVPPPSQTVQQPVPQPPNTVPQPQQTVPQPPNTAPQPPYTVPQPPHTVLHPLHTVPQPPQTVPHPLHTMPPPPQTTTPLPHPGSNEGAPFPTFVQFTMPPNYFPSSVLNSTTPLQHAVPSSVPAPHSSTMSLLNALHDDKLALILPVLMRMEHKIDQLMAMIGAKSSIAMDGLQIGNQLNATVVGNQSNATAVRNQSNAMPVRNQSHITAVRNQLNATAVRNQSNVTTVRNQSNVTGRNHLNATMIRNQFNSSTRGTQNNATTSNQATAVTACTNQANVTMTATPSNTTVNAPAVMETQSSASTMDSQSSAILTETHLNDPENQEDADTMMEYRLSALTPLSRSAPFKTSQSLPGMSARQRIQLEMAKITEQILPDDLDLPISRDNIIAMQARSNSTMNFAVRLLRELFTPDELIGRNISGVRGKDRVDPIRVDMIKELVFKIYRTSPADKELLWRYCRKAIDSFLRKMQQPIIVQEHDRAPEHD